MITDIVIARMEDEVVIDSLSFPQGLRSRGYIETDVAEPETGCGWVLPM